jgi:hypothetical protein
MKEKNTDKYKDLVISNILSFGRYEHPVTARLIWEKSDRAICDDDFQRCVTKVIEKYQTEQIALMEEGKEYTLILSLSGGYFVPQNATEGQYGVIFYGQRALPILKRRRLLKRMVQKKFMEPVVYTKKEIPTVKQESLFE